MWPLTMSWKADDVKSNTPQQLLLIRRKRRFKKSSFSPLAGWHVQCPTDGMSHDGAVAIRHRPA